MELHNKIAIQPDDLKNLMENLKLNHDLNDVVQEFSNGSRSEISSVDQSIGPLSVVFPTNDLENVPPIETTTNGEVKEPIAIDLLGVAKIENELNAMLEIVKTQCDDQIILEIDGDLIEKEGISTLNPGLSIDGSIMDAYFKIILKRNKSARKLCAYNYLRFDYLKMEMNRNEDINPFEFDIVFIPVLKTFKEKGKNGKINCGHWVLAVIRIKEKVIEFYDSKLGKFSKITDEIERFLKQEAGKLKLSSYESGWTIEQMTEIPQQGPTLNCGAFVCLYAEHIALGLPKFDFGEDLMDYARMRMQYDILKGGIIDQSIADEMQSALDNFHSGTSQQVAKPRVLKRRILPSRHSTRANKLCVDNSTKVTVVKTSSTCGRKAERRVRKAKVAKCSSASVNSQTALNCSLPMSTDIVYAAYLSALKDPSFDAVSPDDPPSVEPSSYGYHYLKMFTSEATNSPCSSGSTPYSGGFFSSDDCVQSIVVLFRKLSLTDEVNFSCANSQISSESTLESSSFVHDAKSNAPEVAQTPTAFIARARNGPKTVEDYLAELPTYVQPDKPIVLHARRMELLPGQGSKSLRDRKALLTANPNEIGKYKIGDLVWAKTNGYSHWPGMIVIDPFYPKDRSGRIDIHAEPMFATKVGIAVTEYHVQFFGYKQFRQWVPTSEVDDYIPYARYKEEVLKPRLEALYYAKDKTALIRKEMVKEVDMDAWNEAQAEAELMGRKTNAERIQYTFEYVKRPPLTKAK